MKWGECNSKEKSEFFPSISSIAMLLFISHKSETYTVLTIIGDQTKLLSNLGANHVLIENASLIVSGRSHSGYFWETNSL